jgi:hypothetical protein
LETIFETDREFYVKCPLSPDPGSATGKDVVSKKKSEIDGRVWD